ncbi:hypothetical protein BH10BAC5_BH10BAC5_22480 [soil metagenome]
MKIKLKYVFAVVLFFTCANCFAQDTIKIMAWNLLGYRNSPSNREQYYRKVIKYADPDIITVNEIDGQSTVTGFLNNVMNYYTPGVYAAGIYINGFDTDNAIFYKVSKFQFLTNQPIATPLGRDVNNFVVRHIVSNQYVNILGCHLKASTGSANEIRRANEVAAVRNVTNSYPAGTNFTMQGDFNFYSSLDSAYKNMVRVVPGNEGQFIDPYPLVTGTYNNAAYSQYHTQSTRTRALSDSGATGGLDDRFDFIFYSKAVKDTGGMYYIPNSCKPLGNDGLHYNDSINRRPNASVPDSIADALYGGSDHLPIISLFKFTTVSAVSNISSFVPDKFFLKQNYPNPFNPVTNIEFDIPRSGNVKLTIFNSLGKEVSALVNERLSPGSYRASWDASAFSSGMYFYKLEGESFSSTKKMLLVK